MAKTSQEGGTIGNDGQCVSDLLLVTLITHPEHPELVFTAC